MPPVPTRRQLLLTAAALPMALAACEPHSPPFRVGAIAFAGYSFLFLAEQVGLLTGTNTRLHELRSNTDVLRALAIGRLEAAALTLDEVLTGVHDGLDLKVVAVLDVSAGADAVVARPGLSRLDQVRGQRVAAESSASGALMLAAFLDAAGLKPTDIQQVPVSLSETAEVLHTGRADLVVTAEPWASQLESGGAHRLFDSRAIPGRIVDVLAVRADALRVHAKALQALIHAHFTTLAQYQARPSDWASRLAPLLQLPPERVAAAFVGLDFPDLATNRQTLGPDGTVARGIPGLARLLHTTGLVERPIPTEGLIDLRWLGGTP